MLLKTKKTTRKWLTLLFIASFLLNIQASYACDMMPDMAEKKAECCCGANHRLSTLPDAMEGVSHATDFGDALAVHGQICNDPHQGCCVVEMSVGINDPPSDDSGSITGFSNVVPHKIVKQLDSYFPDAVFCVSENLIEQHKFETASKPPNPYLHFYSPPLYQTTERYRI